MANISRAKWEAGYTLAHIWWCGDDECDCIQPIIERITPNREAGYPWIRREAIWEGTFVSRGSHWPDDPDEAALDEELRAACLERGLPDPSGAAQERQEQLPQAHPDVPK